MTLLLVVINLFLIVEILSHTLIGKSLTCRYKDYNCKTTFFDDKCMA